MRRLALPLCAFALIACKHKGTAAHRSEAQTPAANNQIVINAPATNFVKMSAPDAPRELVHGFYGLESGQWRWTASKFAVILLPPAQSPKGSTLEFTFSLPEVVISKTGPVTLSAKVNGFPIPSQTYSVPGDQTFTADIPPEVLRSGTAYIEFSTDKSLPPSGSDRRELALVAISVGLLAK